MKPQGAGSKNRPKDALEDDLLDEKLKQLGEDFLEEQVPEALLDVLRRATAKRSEAVGTEADTRFKRDSEQGGKSDDET